MPIPSEADYLLSDLAQAQASVLAAARVMIHAGPAAKPEGFKAAVIAQHRACEAFLTGILEKHEADRKLKERRAEVGL